MHNCTLCGRVWALQGGFSDALAPLNINTNELHACTRLTPLSAKKKSPEGKAKLANKEKTSQFESWQYFENDTKRHQLVAQCSCTRWLQQTHTCRRANSFSMAFVEGRALPLQAFQGFSSIKILKKHRTWTNPWLTLKTRNYIYYIYVYMFCVLPIFTLQWYTLLMTIGQCHDYRLLWIYINTSYHLLPKVSPNHTTLNGLIDKNRCRNATWLLYKH